MPNQPTFDQNGLCIEDSREVAELIDQHCRPITENRIKLNRMYRFAKQHFPAHAEIIGDRLLVGIAYSHADGNGTDLYYPETMYGLKLVLGY